jgi:small subunit ribosomal protein S21
MNILFQHGLKIRLILHMLIIKSKGKKIEYVLKEYRKKVERTKLMRECRSRKEFEKPSTKKRRIKNKAKYINKKNNNNDQYN